jgi:hypothetical protein
MNRLTSGRSPAVIAVSLFLTIAISTCADPGEGSSGQVTSNTASDVDIRVIVTPADQLNLTSDAFDVGWRVSSDGDATQSSVGAVNVQVGLISAAITDNFRFDVTRTGNTAEARSEMTERRAEKSESFAIKEIDIGDEAFVWGAAGFFEVRFRYRNILGVVSSSASFPYKGSESKARKWAERLYDKITSVGVLGSPSLVPTSTPIPASESVRSDSSNQIAVLTAVPQTETSDSIVSNGISSSSSSPIGTSDDTPTPTIYPTRGPEPPTPTVMEVGPTPIPNSALADVTISITGHSPLYFDPGDIVTWNYSVTNIGAGNTNSSFGVAVFGHEDLNTPLQNVRIETPNRHTDVTGSFVIPAQAGQRLEFLVDYLDEIEEGELPGLEGGSYVEITDVYINTDLLVLSVTPQASPVINGQPTGWDAVIKNNGPGISGVSGSAKVYLGAEGQTTDIDNVPVLLPGETFATTFSRHASEGATLTVSVVQSGKTDISPANDSMSVNVSDFF